MESGTSILKVTGSIVAAFQVAADTLEMIKDRKEKKKRKKDKEIEELLEMKILHRSLIEGGTRCRKHCENRYQQFNPAFEAGDDIAIAALEEVHNSLQTEVIQALQIARAVENAVLDLTALHEASVTNRKDATRAMDQLCQRIMASMQFQPQHTTSASGSSMRSSFVSVPVSALTEQNNLPPSPPGSILGSPRQITHQRAFSSRTLTIRSLDDKLAHKGRYNVVQASPLSEINLPADHSTSDLTIIDEPALNAGGDRPSSRDRDDPEPAQTYQFTVHHAPVENDNSSVHSQAPSATSISPQNHQVTSPKNEIESESQAPVCESPRQTIDPKSPQQTTDSTAQPIIIASTQVQIDKHRYSDPKKALSTLSQSNDLRPLCLPSIETVRDEQYDFEAPEAVLADFEGMQPMSAHEDFAEKYLAFPTQADYAERLLTLPPGLDNAWLPLTRPAMHNRYHGFCKGAWQIRRSAHEGLDVQLTSAVKDPVLYWTCKECNFKAKAPNVDSLPSHILFNQKYGVRYRWLFLAKSHRDAAVSCDTADNYKYGCIFCSAQGHTTAAFDKLDHLLVHIVSKHKTTMMTPEILGKTKCVVGNVAHQARDDWDINIPETAQKGAGMVADEFMILASKLFGRKKGKRSRIAA